MAKTTRTSKAQASASVNAESAILTKRGKAVAEKATAQVSPKGEEPKAQVSPKGEKRDAEYMTLTYAIRKDDGSFKSRKILVPFNVVDVVGWRKLANDVHFSIQYTGLSERIAKIAKDIQDFDSKAIDREIKTDAEKQIALAQLEELNQIADLYKAMYSASTLMSKDAIKESPKFVRAILWMAGDMPEEYRTDLVSKETAEKVAVYFVNWFDSTKSGHTQAKADIKDVMAEFANTIIPRDDEMYKNVHISRKNVGDDGCKAIVSACAKRGAWTDKGSHRPTVKPSQLGKGDLYGISKEILVETFAAKGISASL